MSNRLLRPIHDKYSKLIYNCSQARFSKIKVQNKALLDEEKIKIDTKMKNYSFFFKNFGKIVFVLAFSSVGLYIFYKFKQKKEIQDLEVKIL